jgi:hypothetical protein
LFSDGTEGLELLFGITVEPEGLTAPVLLLPDTEPDAPADDPPDPE